MAPTEKQREVWVAKLQESWAAAGGERSLTLRTLPTMPQYRRKNFDDLPAQRVFASELLSEARDSADPAGFLGVQILMTGYLDEESCRAEFGDPLVDRGLREARHDIAVGITTVPASDPPADVDLWQACFGVPGIDRSTSAACAICPQATACGKMADLVLREVQRKHGTRDPIGVAQRAGQRRRTAEHRARKAASAHPV